MLSLPPSERLTLPPVPLPPPRTGFPIVATVAPVVVSLGIWAFTGSPYSLLFAALGPVVAVGGVVDGHRQRRRSIARDLSASVAALERLRERIEVIHERERIRRRARVAHVVDAAGRWARDGRATGDRATGDWPLGGWAPGGWAPGDRAPDASIPVLLGVADLAPVIELSGGEEPLDATVAPQLRDTIAALRRVASRLTAGPLLADARDGIAMIGPPLVVRAVARSLVLQLALQLPPDSVTLRAPRDERWAEALPLTVTFGEEHHYRLESPSGGPLVVAWGSSPSELPPGIGQVVVLRADETAHYLAVSVAMAADTAHELSRVADSLGLCGGRGSLPRLVPLAELLAEAPSADGFGSNPTTGEERHSGSARSLRAPLGRDAGGVVEVDLVRDGPHAMVAGTTGTGKSELLVSWVLAMAARHPPTAVTFLLIDFKGGAAFAPLAGLAHVVGIVSDLDARRSRRAIESLRAELRRRETLLARCGARSIEELPVHEPLARLVIVIDEFAAVVSGEPELHDVFADLAARGRSLGLHLVLCTQRPAGVIRDGVLANVTLRISLRVIDRSDSVAMLGTEAASQLPSDPRGRAVIVDGTGAVREVQLALADPLDAERIRTATLFEGSSASRSVWCEPLPELILREELEREARQEDPDRDGDSSRDRIAVGRMDLPAEQRQPIAWYDPHRDGHVLVLGAPRSGTTNALAMFARDPRSRVVPGDPADAWAVVEEFMPTKPHSAGGEPQLLIIDDLDVLIDRFDPDVRHEFVERLIRCARESRQLCLIAAAQRITPGLQRLAAMFESRILLRQSNRDEHILAGGDGTNFDPRLPPGAGTWRGAPVQLAFEPDSLSAPVIPAVRLVSLIGHGGSAGSLPIAIVAGRPRDLDPLLDPRVDPLLAQRELRIMRLGEDLLDEPELRVWRGQQQLVLLGDPDAWQAEWSLLGWARRELPIVVIGCTASELRAIARTREVPPPLGDRQGECWLVEGEVVSRALLRR